MALSQAAQLMKDELERLEDEIRDRESDARILNDLGSPRRMEVQSKLNASLAKRDQMLAAIRKEEARNG